MGLDKKHHERLLYCVTVPGLHEIEVMYTAKQVKKYISGLRKLGRKHFLVFRRINEDQVYTP